MNAIEIKNLTKKYQNTTALDNLSIMIEPAKIFGFLGPDGAGKTTLLRILCGILTPTDGKISVLGIDVLSEPEKLKQQLGYMPQKFALYMDLTVRENLDFFAELFNTPRVELAQRKLELLEFAGLARFGNRLAGKLSGGMKQKLALCCTLIHTPKILILDEPTTGVDPVSRKEFWEMLLPLPGLGTTIIVSTAYMDEAARCDKVALLNQGRILSTGSPEELKKPLAGKIFEIRGENLNEARAGIAGAMWLEDIQVFGDRMHARIKKEISQKEGLELLEKELARRGFHVKVSPIKPSLEDVFVGLLKQGTVSSN